jgi:CRP-like cAMP-binding protein
MQEISFKKGQMAYKEGDKIDGVYFVKSGEFE